MARDLLISLFCATIAALLGKGYYEALRKGVLEIKGRTYCRDEDPILYWISMTVGIVAFLLMASASTVMAFFVYVQLFASSK